MKLISKNKAFAIALTICPILSNAQFSSTIEVNTLNGSNGFVINGFDSLDFLGGAVSYAGDVNGDGNDDLIVGATGADPNGNLSGSSYLVLGSVTGFQSPILPASLIPFNGVHIAENSGSSVSNLGDVNGDNVDDFIIGAYEANTNGNSLSGASYVVFGNTNRFNPTELSSLNGANGFVINGEDQFDLSGYSVSSAGDVNDDGINDIFIGAIYGGSGDNGASYIVYGSSNSFPSSLNISSLNGTNGFAINGISNGDYTGISVDTAGDFNNDGIDDLIIGAATANKSYIVFGNANGLTHPFNLSSLNGNNGFVINGISASDNTGISVSKAGDFNADGIDDVVIGADYADADGIDSGAAYVVFGQALSTFPLQMNLSDLNGNNGFAIHGNAASDYFGESVSNAGDLNGDGIDDLVIGATNTDTNGIDSGSSYVLFGSSTGFPNTISASNVHIYGGFTVNGLSAGDSLGSSVGYAGDVNADGIDDVIVGAENDDPIGINSGASFVIFGTDVIFKDGFE